MNRVLSRSPRQFESSESARKRPHDAVAAAVVDGSCLIDACNVGDLEAVRRLLDEGRNVNEITEEGESLLSLACSSGYAELAQLLLATRANVEDRGLKDTTPLMEASSAGHVDIVKLLISHGANVNAQTSQGNTPLMYACAGGHVDVVKVLIEAGANVEDHNENGHTPLMEAASAGHVAVAKILVERGASINSHSDEFKESALTLACYKGHLEMVRFLLEAGADQEHKTEEMHTALMEASMDGHVEVARLLLDSGAQVNMPADSFESPLTLASCGGHVELAMLLLERGANIEEVNDEGYTPLMEAAREGQEEMVALLLSQGADINAQTEETQETALTLACCSNSLEVADFLIKAGADIEAGGNTPLMEAAQEGHMELVKHLINVGANVNATNANGETALMHACENGHTDVAEVLLDASADLEHEADGGRTPLMKTARAGHLCTVQFLVSRGANVNKITLTNDATPLSLACAGGHLNVVEYLLSQGADPTHRLKDNATMLMEAAKGGHTKVVLLLLDYPNVVCRSPPPEDASPTSAPNLNINSSEPCDTSTTTTITTTTTTATGRLVQRGSLSSSQETSDNQVTSTISQRKSSIISNASGKYGLPKTSRNKSSSFNKPTYIKPSESVEPYIPLPKGRNSSASGKNLERSLSDSSASQLLSTVNLLSNSSDGSSSCSSGTDAFKDTETLSQCISVKLGSNDDLSPSSREQQILHKQQILEELVRVEKELQEKRQEHLLLNQQAGQQQQLIQALCYEPDPFGTDSAPTTSPSLVNTQQQTQATQTLISSLSNMLNSNFRRQLKLIYSNDQSSSSSLQTSNQQNLSQQSQSTQATQTPSLEGLNGEAISNLIPKSPSNRTAISNKSGKGSKSNRGTQQPHHQANLLQLNQSSQLSQTSIPVSSALSLTSQHLQVLKSHLTAVAVSQQAAAAAAAATAMSPVTTSTTTTTPTIESNEPVNISSASILLSSSSSVPTTTVCTLGSSMQVPTNNIVTLGAPAFPVNLSLTPSVSSTPPSPASNLASTTVFSPPITLEMTDGSSSSFVLSAPPKLPDDVSLDFSECPSSQIISSFYALNHQTSPSNNGALFTNSVGPLMETFNFSGIPVSAESFSQSSSILQELQDKSNGFDSSIDEIIERVNPISSVAPSLPSTTSISTGTTSLTLSTAKLKPASSPPPWYPPIDLDSQTDSNHDTALTLACAGGHEELVGLLTKKGANIEHRDKKGFTPLMLVATAGHVGVCELLLINGADIEAQSERTKDTALSLACSSGRYEVVELLLEKNANKEHRNVSDYTPLSLAASGGYVNIIKLLLTHGAEINSRTGSKLGISPLMLAAMNGHTGTVKLLLDMGSDINAQIETNRNTALTLACFQGRKEVVDLLLDRKANVEHRAKTGLTPLMEAASGGYVEVGRILIDKGADVNAPPVPSSRDTALTISADKGHYRFVELLLNRKAQVDVKNKKGSSPLWLACNGGHLDVVQLLVNANADIDSQDNRKVSCLMAAFRKGHVKVVKWMVKHVTQFPSDQEMTRYISMINEDELFKKCHQCMEHIRSAKEKQAAEANKNATILLEEIDMERYREETRKLAAARRREKKRIKKKEKQEKEKAAKAALESKELAALNNKNHQKQGKLSNKRNDEKVKVDIEESDSDLDDEYDSNEEENNIFEDITVIKNNQVDQSPSKGSNKKNRSQPEESSQQPPLIKQETPINQNNELKSSSSSVTSKKKEAEKNRKNQAQKENDSALSENKSTPEKKENRETNKKADSSLVTTPSTVKTKLKSRDQDNTVNNDRGNSNSHDNTSQAKSSSTTATTTTLSTGVGDKKYAQKILSNRKNSNDNFLNELTIEVPRDSSTEKTIVSQKSPCATVSTKSTSSSVSNVSVGNFTSSLISSSTVGLKKGQKREEGWKEVVRRSKKVSVPANAISRVIGRGGCNINAVREISGAHIEVEKQKGQGDRQIIIKGSADATRHAQQLINGLVNETDKDLSQIVSQLGLSQIASRAVSAYEDDFTFNRTGPIKSFSSTSVTSQVNRSSTIVTLSSSMAPTSSISGVTKSSSVSAVFTPGSLTTVSSASGLAARTSSGVVSVRAPAPINSAAPPFGGSVQTSASIPNAWGTPKSSVPRMQTSTSSVPVNQFTSTTVTTSPSFSSVIASSSVPSSGTKTTLSYTSAVASKLKTTGKPSTQPVSNLLSTKFLTGPESKPSSGAPPFAAPVRPQAQPFNSASRVIGPTTPKKTAATKQPFGNNNSSSPGNVNIGGVNGNNNSNNNNVNSNSMTTSTTTSSSSVSADQSPKSSSGSGGPNMAQSSVSNATSEYTPFNNLFSKVAQASVWGASKEPKPNFASVAASGIVSGNSAQTSSPSSSGSSFGPIGSGPRNAPCTPPLSSIGITSSIMSNRPISTSAVSGASSSTSSSPPPPSVIAPTSQQSTQSQAQQSQQTQATQNLAQPISSSQPRNLMKDSTNPVDLMIVSSSSLVSSPVVSAYSNNPGTSIISSGFQSSVSSSVYTSSSLSNHPSIKQQPNFSLTPGSNVSRGYTATTYSQHHGPLTSVDPNHPVVAPSLAVPDHHRFLVQGIQLQNPQQHAPPLHMQMRAAILAAGASLQMQTLQAQAAQAAQAAQSAQAAQVAQAAQNHVRYQLGPANLANPGMHPSLQNAALGGGEFNPPSAETLRLLQTALTAFPAANAVLHQSPPQNMQSYGLMQPPISMRQPHQPGQVVSSSQGQQSQQQQISQQHQHHHPGSHSGQQQQAPGSVQRATQGGLVKETDMSGDMSEERKLPRPIGTERAQKKNPVHGMSNSNMVYTSGMENMQDPANLWPFPSSTGEMPVTGETANEWLLQGTGVPNDELLANMMPVNYMMHRNYVPMNESVPDQHEPDYTVGYPYFPSDI